MHMSALEARPLPRVRAFLICSGLAHLRDERTKADICEVRMFVRAVCVAVWHTGVGIKKWAAGLTAHVI